MIKEVFKKTIKSPIFKWSLGSAGAVNVILLVGKNYFNLTLKQSLIIGLGLLFGLFVLLVLYFLITGYVKYYWRKRKDSIYGDAIIYLKDAFGKIHFLRKDENLTEETLKNSLAFFCQQLKTFFDKKTKSTCAVSIKILQNIKDQEASADAKIYNLCRDKSSLNRDTDTYKAQNHSVFNNTCFNMIFTKITSGKSANNLYYINNNLKESTDYQNTSWSIHSKKEKNTNWLLPYCSELVVPIIPIEPDSGNKYKLIGFICVDSEETDVFHEKYDSAMMQGVADGIYDLILNLNFNA